MDKFEKLFSFENLRKREGNLNGCMDTFHEIKHLGHLAKQRKVVDTDLKPPNYVNVYIGGKFVGKGKEMKEVFVWDKRLLN